MIAKKIVELCEEKYDEGKWWYGTLEGFADGMILMYFPLLIGCYYWRKKAQK